MGLRGRVTAVNYSFKIKLSDYKRVVAVADTHDLAAAIIKLDLIRGSSFHDPPPMTTVNAEVDHPVLCIVVVPTLRNGAGDLHSAEVLE